jgi:hypothetical protein
MRLRNPLKPGCGNIGRAGGSQPRRLRADKFNIMKTMASGRRPYTCATEDLLRRLAGSASLLANKYSSGDV